MSNKFKDINIKNRTFYFFNDTLIQIMFIKTDKKSFKNTFIYYTRYVTIKDSKYVKINSVNHLYLIFIKVNGYFKKLMEINI